MESSPWNLYVFRETHRVVASNRLLVPLMNDLSRRGLADALVRAGEIESSLADVSAPSAQTAMALTDAIAAALVAQHAHDAARANAYVAHALALARMLDPCSSLPAHGSALRVVPPESFSYYGLHPLDFAEQAAAPPFDRFAHVAVVGVRSVGTTLGAIFCAALQARGARAERLSVRPGGDPYERTLRLSAAQAAWARGHLVRGSVFVVIDEGPGLSGSTLL